MLVPGKRTQPLYPISLLRWVAVLFNNDYHVWGKRLPSRRKPEAARLTVRVQATHRRTRKNYGVQRLQEALSDHGVFVGVRPIRLLCRELGICCRRKRKYYALRNNEKI